MENLFVEKFSASLDLWQSLMLYLVDPEKKKNPFLISRNIPSSESGLHSMSKIVIDLTPI